MLAMFLSMVTDVGMPGLQQRVFIFLFLVWLAIVVHRLVRVTRAAESIDLVDHHSGAV
jgi:hypothetical protein